MSRSTEKLPARFRTSNDTCGCLIPKSNPALACVRVAFLEDAVDFERQSCLQQLSLWVRQAQIGEHVAGTVLELNAGFSSLEGRSLSHFNDA